MNNANERDLILGVDPGLSGALAFFNIYSKRLESLKDMPLKAKKNGKNEIDLYELASLIGRYAPRTLFSVVEEVGPRPKEGVVGVFRFGYAAGAAAAAIASFNIPINFVTPQIWKSLFGLTSDKSLSLKMAREMFPGNVSDFKRAKDDGRAEAALLAAFGVRFLKVA